MTQCYKGGHDFPLEDESGAYCEQHGIILLRHGSPVTREVLGSRVAPRLFAPPVAEERPSSNS